MNVLTRWLWRWGPALVVMIVIFLASSTPGNDLPKFGAWDLIGKKGGHMVGYALLSAAYLRGLTCAKNTGRRALLWAILLASFYAVTDEFHQSFTPERDPSPIDVGIDTAGAVLGVSLWTWFRSLSK